jgi:hypothetical protein
MAKGKLPRFFAEPRYSQYDHSFVVFDRKLGIGQSIFSVTARDVATVDNLVRAMNTSDAAGGMPPHR